MPEALFSLSPGEDIHVVNPPAANYPGKPMSVPGLDMADGDRPYRRPVAPGLVIPDGVASAADLPDAISEEDGESTSEAEPLTPSDSDPNLYQQSQRQQKQQQQPQQNGTSNNNSNNNDTNNTRQSEPTLRKPDPIPIPAAPARSPRGSQFFSNPFSSSAGAVLRPPSSTKPKRHHSFKNIFRRNSAIVPDENHLPASPVLNGGIAGSVGAAAGGSGNSPTESKWFGLKRRQSPPSYADNHDQASNMPQQQDYNNSLSETERTPHSSHEQNFTLNGKPVQDGPSSGDRQRRAHSHNHHLNHLKERSKILFGNTPKPSDMAPERVRSPSVGDVHNQPPRPGFSIPANAGVGLKARRMSANLPHDFHVDTCELDEEYVSASKLPGKRGKALGKGATATVKVMARRGHKKGEGLFAVKEFRKCGQHEDKEEYIQKVKSEYSIAASLHHPNIVTTYRLCTHHGRFNHVMELCPHGELFSLVQRGYLTQQDNLCFFKQVCRGVFYLHSKGIAHRDIKLENLLLSEEGHVKISDFGVSEVFSGIHPGLREAHGECGHDMKDIRFCQPGICGSLPYISPEVLSKQQKYDPRELDVWSCAIVMISLVCRGNPWQSADPSDPHFHNFINAWDKFLQSNPDGRISENSMPKCGPLFGLISQTYSPGLRRLLLAMLHPNPSKRLTMRDVLEDKYFKTIECCSPESEEDEAITIDAAGLSSTKKMGKMTIQKVHHHAPPERKILPQHRFDMGDGYS